MEKHFALILGARPNFVKAASLLKKAKDYPQFRFTLIHTGQHFDDEMSKVFFEQFGMPKPDIHLDMDKEGLGDTLHKLIQIFSEAKFDACLVVGDVNSTLLGTLAAVKNNIPVCHIEAGLRSYDKRMPEEQNRIMVDHLASLLFTSEEAGNTNLVKEGISEGRIHLVGNIMIETLEVFGDLVDQSKILTHLDLDTKDFFVSTVHRKENTDTKEKLEKLLNILAQLGKTKTVVFPLHPGTKAKIKTYGLDGLLNNVKIVEPLSYFDFVKLMKESAGVITDSGGIQEETSHLGIPCVTLRDNTERPSTIELGSNKLFNVDSPDIKAMLEHLGKSFQAQQIPLWDKKVSSRIFKVLETIKYGQEK